MISDYQSVSKWQDRVRSIIKRLKDRYALHDNDGRIKYTFNAKPLEGDIVTHVSKMTTPNAKSFMNKVKF